MEYVVDYSRHLSNLVQAYNPTKLSRLVSESDFLGIYISSLLLLLNGFYNKWNPTQVAFVEALPKEKTKETVINLEMRLPS